MADFFNVTEEEVVKVKPAIGSMIGTECSCGLFGDNRCDPFDMSLGPNNETTKAHRYVVFYKEEKKAKKGQTLKGCSSLYHAPITANFYLGSKKEKAEYFEQKEWMKIQPKTFPGELGKRNQIIKCM